MGQGWSQYGHLIVIAIIFLSSVLSWVFRKLREQQQLKALRDAEARRRDEILRTGRDPAAEEAARTAAMLREVEAEARAREQAAAIEVQRQQAEMQRRRDELRRLREQRRSERTGGSPQPQAQSQTQAQPQTQPQPQPQGPVTTRELWPGGPVVVIARSAEEPAEAPRQTFPAPAPTPAFPRAEQPRPRQRTLASDREDYEESVRVRQARADAAIAAGARQQAAQDRKAAAQRTPQTFPLPKTAAQWRAAIVANVILGQPGGLASNDGRSAFGPGAINTGGSPQP